MYNFEYLSFQPSFLHTTAKLLSFQNCSYQFKTGCKTATENFSVRQISSEQLYHWVISDWQPSSLNYSWEVAVLYSSVLHDGWINQPGTLDPGGWLHATRQPSSESLLIRFYIVQSTVFWSFGSGPFKCLQHDSCASFPLKTVIDEWLKWWILSFWNRLECRTISKPFTKSEPEIAVFDFLTRLAAWYNWWSEWAVLQEWNHAGMRWVDAS